MRYLIVCFCCAALLAAGCSKAPEEPAQAHYTDADFVGSWDTTLPNGERWLLVLHEDGRFDSLPVKSRRSSIHGHWSMKEGNFYWRYPDPSGTGGSRNELNPVILKTANTFMLQERMGMESTYTRHVD